MPRTVLLERASEEAFLYVVRCWAWLKGRIAVVRGVLYDKIVGVGDLDGQAIREGRYVLYCLT